jgi:hypothetical protein
MIAPFDIFRVEIDGTSVWRCTAETLEEAKQRVRELAVRELAASSPGKYSIVSIRTNHRLEIVIDGQSNHTVDGGQPKN